MASSWDCCWSSTGCQSSSWVPSPAVYQRSRYSNGDHGSSGSSATASPQNNDTAIIRTVKDDLAGWNLHRMVWVADRGFASAANWP
jgi:hypothetical protein